MRHVGTNTQSLTEFPSSCRSFVSLLLAGLTGFDRDVVSPNRSRAYLVIAVVLDPDTTMSGKGGLLTSGTTGLSLIHENRKAAQTQNLQGRSLVF